MLMFAFNKGGYMKITKYVDIPQFTRDGNWQANFSPKDLITEIDRCVTEDGLQLEPDFQRGHVWTPEQQSAFMEYFLRSGKSGRVIYLNKPDWNRSVPTGAYNDFVCVDGLQRLTAIRGWLNDEVPVFGSLRSEFTDNLRSMSFTFLLNINDLKSKKEVLQWYIGMNAGGTPHSQEEINRVQKLLESEEK